MKTIYEWEKDDIKEGIFFSPSESKILYMIAYNPEGREKEYCIVNLNNGRIVSSKMSKENIVMHLNRTKSIKVEMRIA